MAAVGELIVVVDDAPSGGMPVHSGDVLTLGRAPDCNVRIRLKSVSRVSARLVADGVHAFFINESTSNPAVLTRGALQVPLPLGMAVCLEHGDSLSFSTRDFWFHYGGCCCWLMLYLIPRSGGFIWPSLSLTHTHTHTHTPHTSTQLQTRICSARAAGR